MDLPVAASVDPSAGPHLAVETRDHVVGDDPVLIRRMHFVGDPEDMDAAVSLTLARREFFSGGGFTGTFTPLPRSEDIALQDVAVHYTPDAPRGRHAAELHVAFDDHDIFSAEVNEQVLQFAIRYA